MNAIKPTLIVTRHPALVALLRERGLADDSTRVIEHATPDDVRGAHVLGVLPYHLGRHAASVTEIPMRLTLEDRQAMQRGDITLERLRDVAGDPVTYRVQRLDRVLPVAAAIEAAIETCTIVEDCGVQICDGKLTAIEHAGPFRSEADLRTGLVRHHSPSGWTPWLHPLLSTGRWVREEWVGESECAIART